MRVLGIDIGSRYVKLAVGDEKGVRPSLIMDTAVFYRDHFSTAGTSTAGTVPSVEKTMGTGLPCAANSRSNSETEAISGLDLESFDLVVGTGYGRNNLNLKNAEIILELKAHTIGAISQTGLSDFTLIDIGGQDSKVIHIKNGKMADIALNDKCAASCGRYIENMARLIGMEFDEIGNHSENPAELSSTCAVFGESELIGKIAEGVSNNELAAGINYSLFKRIKPLLTKSQSPTAVLTGGVAENKALRYFMKEQTDFKDVIVPDYPQYNGAIGCCIYGIKKLSGGNE